MCATNRDVWRSRWVSDGGTRRIQDSNAHENLLVSAPLPVVERSPCLRGSILLTGSRVQPNDIKMVRALD
jgi:hypothetical protein